MAVNKDAYQQIKTELDAAGVALVAVSKTKPIEDILELYHLGQRDFGENYVQELVDKAAQLPPDIRWHFIGHLQSNKVKYIAPFVHLIHGVDSKKLLLEVDKQALKLARQVICLLQVHIAREETKFGFDEEEVKAFITDKVNLEGVSLQGLMGMASLTDDVSQVKEEFSRLHRLFEWCGDQEETNFEARILSMGMSGDYRLAIQSGTTMVRIGSLLFGTRG